MNITPPLPATMPPRGSASFNSDTRGDCRKWLTSRGASYSQIKNLTLTELAAIYNDTTDAALRTLLASVPDVSVNVPLAAALGHIPAPAPQTPQEKPAAKAAPIATVAAADMDERAALIARLLAPAPVQIDEEAIRAIAREEAGKAAGIAPVRVVIQDRHKGDMDAGVQHRAFPDLVAMLSADCNVWLAGPAGTGKTTAASNAAKALGRPFHFNGAIDSEHKLLGFTDAQGRIVSRPFREAFINGGIYLFDEVDASLPGALLAFNAALANGHCDFPDGCKERHADFVCIGAANTYGHGATHDYVGRAKMDAAFLDRFVSLDWPVDPALESAIALSFIADSGLGQKWVAHVQGCRARSIAAGIKVVISPRASIHGVKLLQAGMKWEAAEAATIRKGMAAESWKQIKG